MHHAGTASQDRNHFNNRLDLAVRTYNDALILAAAIAAELDRRSPQKNHTVQANPGHPPRPGRDAQSSATKHLRMSITRMQPTGRTPSSTKYSWWMRVAASVSTTFCSGSLSLQ